MITANLRRSLALATALVGLVAAAAAAQTKPAVPAAKTTRSAARFGRYTIEAMRLEGSMGGPWDFTKEVVVTGPDGTLTCDRLRIWPSNKAGVDFERAEAEGHVVIKGTYRATDNSEWKVVGAAAAGSYDRKAGQGVLRGNVKFSGVNLATGAQLAVEADKLIYEIKSRQFRFEKGAQPVRVQWQEPETPAAPAKAEGGK